MVKNITTFIFNSFEVKKETDNYNNNTSFSIDVPPIIIKNKAILKVSNFCHIGTATGHADNMYIFRIRNVIINNAKYICGVGSGNNPVILSTTFNNNRSIYDENIISLVKQTINTIDILVDTYYPDGLFNNINIVNGGSGYLTGQILKFNGGGNNNDVFFSITAISGVITSFNFINTPPFINYNTEPILQTYINGSGANLTAILTTNTISSITINNGGNGYIAGQTLSFVGGGGSGANISIATVNALGSILSFTFTSNGTGYITPPAISINNTTQTQTAILIPKMIYDNITNGISNSLNFSITFTIEEDEF